MPGVADEAGRGYNPVRCRALWHDAPNLAVAGRTVAGRQNAASIVAERALGTTRGFLVGKGSPGAGCSLGAICGFLVGQGVDAGAAGQNNG